MISIPIQRRRLEIPAGACFAAVVFGAFLLIASIISGLVITVQVGYALEVFEAIKYLPRIVGLTVARANASHVAAISVCFALVAWAHRAGPRGAPGTWRSRLCLPFAMMLATVLPAAGLILAASCAAARAVHGLTWTTFTTTVLEFATPADVAFGFTKAAVYGAMLGAGAAAAGPVIARGKWRLRWKLAVSWVVLGFLMGLADHAINPSSAGEITVDPSGIVQFGDS